MKRRFSWPMSRQRLIELGVVVFGVMIALALENLVQEVRLRGDARDLERAFDQEVMAAVVYSLERQVSAPCFRQDLTRIEQRVLQSGGAAEAMTFPPAVGNYVYVIPQPYRPVTRFWTTAAFDRALGSEAFKRIPSERAAEYAMMFALITRRGVENGEEFMVASRLTPAAYAQAEMGEEVRADTLRDLSLLDRYNAIAAGSADQLIALALSMSGGNRIAASIVGGEADIRRMITPTRPDYGACADLGAIDRLMEQARQRVG
ncbi:hypothetical protein [Brevundimonas sp. GCM10030266]|uniref:hypothetical protein n=1 Tax=Brevundimonas sp. GCM10030266 TaxID=3273386 RepID=UPI003623599C